MNPGDDGGDDGAAIDAAGGGEPDAAGGVPDAAGGDVDAALPPDGGGGDRDGGVPPDGGSDTDAGAPQDGGAGDAGTPSDGGALDGGGAPDAGTPDAGGDELDGEFLLSIATDIFPDNPIRFIATVDFTPAGEGGTADFSFQPIIAPNCVPEMSGLPIGDPVAVTGIPISAAGAFDINLIGATLPGDANPIPILSCGEFTGDLVVAGTVVNPDLTCGDVTIANAFAASFGAIRIAPGTVGDANLPAPVTECPAP